MAELERGLAAGAVLLKWLPIVQNFNPADPRCFPVYEALAHHKLPEQLTVIDELPLTAMEKVDKAALARRYRA